MDNAFPIAAERRSETVSQLQLSTAEPPPPSPSVSKTPSKSRSFSDSTPALSPSPFPKEPLLHARDEDELISTPTKSARRHGFHARGLTLNLPPQHNYSSNHSGHGRSQSLAQIDTREGYGSPSSVLPRHSRGLDFARACTNLHHSTLAESSPDASPTVTQRNMMPRSRRASMHSMALDSPRISSGWSWSNSGCSSKGILSSSVGSGNAMASDNSSNSSDDDIDIDLQEEMEDTVMAVPQFRKSDSAGSQTVSGFPNIPSLNRSTSSGSSSIPHAFSGFRQGRGRYGGHQASNGNGDLFARQINDDPITMSPDAQNLGYFGLDTSTRSRSRRDSLNIGTRLLNISSNTDSSEESSFAVTPTTPSVVRRPVTRRSNLLPKTKGFARIRAQLQEESAPADNEARKEAEVVKQVWSTSEVAGPSSPEIVATGSAMLHESSEASEVEGLGLRDTCNPMKAPDVRRGSNSKEFWPNMYSRTETPPPPLFHRARSSSGMSEDVGMESPHVSTPPSSVLSRVSTQMPDFKDDPETPQFQQPALPSTADVLRKVNNKRGRDEDFDPASIKRRAVSPGMSSVQNSPVLGQSPVSNTGTWMAQAKQSRDGSTSNSTADEKSASGGSVGQATPNLGPKRVGLLGMTDTSDGVMKMSIE